MSPPCELVLLILGDTIRILAMSLTRLSISKKKNMIIAM